MSRLDELIAELCPNGVEYVKLSSICDIKRGERVTKSQLIEDGIYPVFSGGVSPMGYFNKFNREENTITIAQYGTAGYVNWIDEKFWANDVCYSLFPKEVINKRYLYFVLVNLQDYIYRLRIDAVPAHLPVDRLGNIKIPLPPLPVQQEIVRILDTFTELIKELNAELDRRRKQYEYYRDLLLTFGDEVEWKPLEESIVSLTTGLNPRRFFRLNTDDALNYYVTVREIQNNTIVFSDKTDRINDEALKLCNNRSNLEVGDVLFSGTGTIGETAVVSEPPTNWNIKEGVYAIKPNQNKLLPRFLMYLLQSNEIRSNYLAKAAGGVVKSVPMKAMRKLKIPVPPLEEQERIVAILDRFDALCNDLTSGIPAEIEAREKQFKYYLNKLLDFKEVTS